MSDYRLIPLGGKYGENKFVKVDPEDYPTLSLHGWSLRQGYPSAMIKGRVRAMHRVIMGEPVGKCVDHKNHNTLDNRRQNLRVCSKGQNNMNTVGRANRRNKFKGVTYRTHMKRTPWCARIGFNGRKLHIGYFVSEEEAACAYNEKAKELHGEYAKFNEI